MKFTLKRFSLALALVLAAPLSIACTGDERTQSVPRGSVEVIYSDLCIDCADEIDEGAEPVLANCPPPCGADRAYVGEDLCAGCQDS